MKNPSGTLAGALTVASVLALALDCRGQADHAEISRITGDAKPFFEIWDEEVVYGVLDVAMDGTVLMFSLQGEPHPDKRKGSKIFLKRSEDGGATWSDHQLVGERIDLDVEALGIGPYDGKGWGNDKHHRVATLGTSIVDEATGEIMIFLTALHPASSMYKSVDNGKTWKLEKIEIKKDSKGFLSIPNAACDSGITLKHGAHKGRLLVPSRVMPNYSKHEESKGYTNAVYSDDHGKTWHPSAPFPLDGTGESGLVELNDGTIYLNSRTHTRAGNRWVAYSDDSGETWRDLHQDDELFDGPPDVYGCKAGLLRLDRDDADILLFSSPSPNLPERKNIRVWVSFDGGKTWPLNRLIKRGPGNYTWMAQGRKGTPSEGFVYLLAGKDWMARFNMAWLLDPGDPEMVLSKRKRYRFGDADLFRSSENAAVFTSSDSKLNASPVGYRLARGKGEGRVLTQRLLQSSGKMNVSYHVPDGGKLYVWLMDDSDTRLRDSHALTGTYQIDKPIEWQDGGIDKWVGKIVYAQFMLEGGAEVFGFSFDDVAVTGDDAASIGPSDDGFVLPPRNDYLMAQNPPFVKSVQNAKPFDVSDDRLAKIRAGYRLGGAKGRGHVLSHKISLPGSEMKISCDVTSGSIAVSIFDEKGKLVRTSKPMSGGLKVREPVQWPDGFKLDDHVSKPVSLRLEIEGGAKLFAIRFDKLFWE
jgi:sialidase-1